MPMAHAGVEAGVNTPITAPLPRQNRGSATSILKNDFGKQIQLLIQLNTLRLIKRKIVNACTRKAAPRRNSSGTASR